MNRTVRYIALVALMPFLSGCFLIDWLQEGYQFYQQGREFERLSHADTQATAVADALKTMEARTATSTQTATLAAGETPAGTATPAPPPTPTPLYFVRVRGRNVWFKFYSNAGMPGSSGSSGSTQYGSSIWDGLPLATPSGSEGSTGVVEMGVIGSYNPEFRQSIPVVGKASGDEFCQLYIVAWIEVADLSADLTTTVGLVHNWLHAEPMIHAHLWPEPRTDDRDLLMGFVEPGHPVRVLEIDPTGLMVKAAIPMVWTECSALELVEEA